VIEPRRPTSPAELSVDIVVNNYNYACFLADAVDSALAQTHSQVNVIVVDDGSTDDSRALLATYDAKVELVLKANGGQASALNAGFARSTGDVVIFLDADDTLAPNAASLVAAAFAEDPRVVKAQYRMEVIDETGRRTGIVKPAPHLPLPQGDVARAELIFPFDLVWLATSGNAFRADALRRIVPIPERDFASFPDWYLVHLTPLLGPVVSLTEVAAFYRVHDANSYEQAEPRLDLDHVRQTITYAAATTRALGDLGDELGLERPKGAILSVSDLANRLVSRKLDAARHPNPSDSVWRLAIAGSRAAHRRFDVSISMKILYIAWFMATAVAPRALARTCAELLLFPERRGHLNRVLGRFHRGRVPSELSN
jgi:glycosyltransferase involved in cell wall biosynthesis